MNDKIKLASPANENYQKNMEAMEKTHPEFAKLIKETPDVDWILDAPKTKENQTNLFIRDSRFKDIMIYPEPIGNESLDSQVTAQDQKGTLLFGLGAGHALAHLLKIREPKHSILIIEPIMHLWRIALSEYDFSEALKDGTLFPCPGPAEVEYCLAWIEGHRALDGWNKVIDRVAYRRAEYWQLMDETMCLLNQSMGNIGTVESHGEEIALNDIGTIPWVIRHRGVKELVGMYKDKPAIVVATGPSLTNNIHLLKEVQKNKSAIIIAVAQALRPLLSYGIRPDFICTVDFGEVNMSHLDGLMDQDVPLVTISKAYKPLVQSYKGPKFVSASPLEGAPETSISNLLNHRGALMQGGSVMHMCVGLAACLGCNPIVLMGVDLSYPTKKTSHFGQADSSGEIEVVDDMLVWKVKDPRSSLAKKTNIMGMAVYVEGYFGEDVVTNSGLHSFITTLEAFIMQAKGAGVTVIDATEGGAYIKDTKRMFLQDVIEKYCKEEIDKSIIEPLLTFAQDADELIKKAIPILDEDIKTLNNVIHHAQQGIRYANKAKKYWQKDILLDIFKNNSFHTKETHMQARKILAMGYILIRALRKMESRELMLSKEEEVKIINDSTIREKSIKRNLYILKAARDGAEKLRSVYLETHNILCDYMYTENNRLEPIGEIKFPSLKDAKEYFNEGNFARPLLEAQRILKVNPDHDDALDVQYKAFEMRDAAITKARLHQQNAYVSGLNKVPIYLDLIQESIELGRDKKLQEAVNKITEAVSLIPSRAEGRWGLATLLTACERYGEALAEYRWLQEKEPDNLRFDFETGQVLLKIEGCRAEGITLIENVIEKDPATYGQFKKELEEIKD